MENCHLPFHAFMQNSLQHHLPGLTLKICHSTLMYEPPNNNQFPSGIKELLLTVSLVYPFFQIIFSKGNMKNSAVPSHQCLSHVSLPMYRLPWTSVAVQSADVTRAAHLLVWRHVTLIFTGITKSDVKSWKMVRFWRFKRLGPLKKGCPTAWNGQLVDRTLANASFWTQTPFRPVAMATDTLYSNLTCVPYHLLWVLVWSVNYPERRYASNKQIMANYIEIKSECLDIKPDLKKSWCNHSKDLIKEIKNQWMK